MKFKTKAEVMFDKKMKLAVANRDFDMVAELFGQYGCYLMLVSPIEEMPTKAIVHLPHYGQEPQAEEEIIHMLSGDYARWCVETLHADPLSLEKIDPTIYPTYQSWLDRPNPVEYSGPFKIYS